MYAMLVPPDTSQPLMSSLKLKKAELHPRSVALLMPGNPQLGAPQKRYEKSFTLETSHVLTWP